MNIEKLLLQGESNTVEFKQNFSREVIETAGAFANTKGGAILVGISDNAKIVGTTIGKETLNNWSNQISQSSEPSILADIETIEFDNKTIVQIYIKEYPLKPVSVRGRCYRRIKNSNHQMTPSEITEMHLQATGNSWDALSARDKTTADIDPEKVKEFIKWSVDTGRRKFLNENNLSEILSKLELQTKNQPSWAGILLFGKNPQSPLTQAKIHCGRFKEETTIIDDRLISGSIIHQIDDTIDFIRKNINVEFRITGKPQREEVWDYPMEALREAVINAVCHRDYSKPSDIQLKIYDDSIRIWNPGSLPLGMSIEDLYDPLHPSVPRNKLIAQIFFDIGFIERYGSGIQRMIVSCKDMKIPEPEFEEKFGGFMITFRRDILTEKNLERIGLDKRLIKAVMYVKTIGDITNIKYQKEFNVSKATATRDLTLLVSKGILSQYGKTGKGTFYQLKDSQTAQRTH